MKWVRTAGCEDEELRSACPALPSLLNCEQTGEGPPHPRYCSLANSLPLQTSEQPALAAQGGYRTRPRSCSRTEDPFPGPRSCLPAFHSVPLRQAEGGGGGTWGPKDDRSLPFELCPRQDVRPPRCVPQCSGHCVGGPHGSSPSLRTEGAAQTKAPHLPQTQPGPGSGANVSWVGCGVPETTFPHTRGRPQIL